MAKKITNKSGESSGQSLLQALNKIKISDRMTVIILVAVVIGGFIYYQIQRSAAISNAVIDSIERH